MTRYQPTAQASAELREAMRHPLRVPFPLTPAEDSDFVLFLRFQGVQVTPSRKHPGNYNTDTDMCPFVWRWREQRGEVRPKESA